MDAKKGKQVGYLQKTPHPLESEMLEVNNRGSHSSLQDHTRSVELRLHGGAVRRVVPVQRTWGPYAGEQRCPLDRRGVLGVGLRDNPNFRKSVLGFIDADICNESFLVQQISKSEPS